MGVAKWWSSLRPIDRVAVALIMGVSGGMAAAFAGYTGYDDAFITMRHSWNLLSGKGLVYNESEVFLGTSTPGFALLLAMFSLPWREAMPTVANLIGGVSLIAASLAMFEFSRMHGRAFVGFVAALLFTACPLALLTISGEMLLQLALVLWAFVLLERKASVAGAGFVAAACIVRPDAALAAVAYFVVLRIRRRGLPGKELAVFSTPVAAFYAAMWLIYGSPVPGSMTAKSLQRAIGWWGDFWPDAHKLAGMVPYWPIVLAVVTVGGVIVAWRHRYWGPPIFWAALVAAMYSFMNPPAYHWYLLPFVWLAAVLAAATIDAVVALANRALTSALKGRKTATIKPTIQGLAILALLPFLLGMAQVAFSFFQDRIAYVEVAEWLRERLPEGAKVAHSEIGYIGYHLPNAFIVDPLGLVHPDIALQAVDKTFAAFDHYQPDVVLYRGPYATGDFERHYAGATGFVRVHSLPDTSEGFIDVYMTHDLADRLGLQEVPSIRVH